MCNKNDEKSLRVKKIVSQFFLLGKNIQFFYTKR